MKSTKFISTLLFGLFLIFTSCRKEDGNSSGEQQENIPDAFSEYFGNEISRDFLGTVIDKNNLPITGVTISIGNETALTDNNGVFIIRDATINQRFGYVKAEKAGYIHGSRSVVPSEGTNKVTIMLLEANVVGTVNSGSSETVSLSNGSSVSFDGNFIKEDGSIYSGSVNVIMHHLNPADEDMPAQMPGMLYAQNELGAERMLQTLGMLAVELRGENEEDLNLAEGSTSEIKIPVDASLMGIAPSTIALWYFDEVNGYWKEEGEATLQGNMYIGNVAHFSFWNCDIPIEAITLCITVTDNENNTFNNLYVDITSAISGTRGGTTNANGEVCGYVPSNETLELNIYSYDLCGEIPLYSGTIGPFLIDANIAITIILPDNTDLIAETVTGNFNTCEGNTVTDGYVQLNYQGQEFIDLVNDGTFIINVLHCNVENSIFSIKGTDYTNIQFTTEINYTFTTPITDIGTITACNSVTEYVQYTVGENNTVLYINNLNVIYEPLIGLTYPYTHELNITGSTSIENQSHSFTLGLRPVAPYYLGTYTNDDIWFYGYDGWSGSSFTTYIDNFNLSALDEVGEYIDISFSGLHSSGDGVKPINGIIHVLRDE